MMKASEAAQLRRKVAQDFPAALDETCRVSLDFSDAYWKMVSTVAGKARGVDAIGAAFALAKLVEEAGGAAWVCEFGLQDVVMNAATIVETSDGFEIHDAFLNAAGDAEIERLATGGRSIRFKADSRNMRVCVVDEVGSDPRLLADILALATRELPASGPIRRFVLPLGPETALALRPNAIEIAQALQDEDLPETLGALLARPLRLWAHGAPVDADAVPEPFKTWFLAPPEPEPEPALRLEHNAALIKTLRLALGESNATTDALRTRVARLEAATSVSGASDGDEAPQHREAALEAGRVNQSLIEELESLRAQAALKEEALQLATEEMSKAQGETVELRAEVERSAHRLDQLRAAIEQAAEEATAQQADRGDAALEAGRVNQSLIEELESLRAQAALKEEALQLATEEMSKAQGETVELRAEVERSAHRLDQLRAAIEQAAEEATAQQADRREAEDTWKARIAETVVVARRAEADAERLSAELQERSAVVEALSRECDLLQDAARHQHSSSAEQIATIGRDLAGATAYAATLRLEIEAQKSKSARDEARRAEIDDRIKRLIADATPLLGDGVGRGADPVESLEAIARRLSEVEEERAAANAALTAHQNILLNSRYMKIRRLVGRIRRRIAPRPLN